MDSPAVRTRRAFLRRVLKYSFSFILGLFGIITLRFLYPASVKKRSVQFEYLFMEEELPKQGVKKVNLSYQNAQKVLSARVFVVNHAGQLYALSATCSHYGCLVDWSRQKKLFLCPCHGGKYDIEGLVTDGPPPLPLTRLPLRIESGRVTVGLTL